MGRCAYVTEGELRLTAPSPTWSLSQNAYNTPPAARAEESGSPTCRIYDPGPAARHGGAGWRVGSYTPCQRQNGNTESYNAETRNLHGKHSRASSRPGRAASGAYDVGD